MFVILVPKVDREKNINSGLWNSLKIPVLNRELIIFFYCSPEIVKDFPKF